MEDSGSSTNLYRGAALLWTIGILVACSIPAASLAPVEPMLGMDKAIHFGLFVVFGGLWMRVLCPPRVVGAMPCARRYGLIFVAVGMLFAVLTEVYQHVLPLQRTGDPYDALANGAGLVVAVLGYVLFVSQWSPPDSA